MLSPILEAGQLAKQNGITISPVEQAAYFLRKVWGLMPDDHLLGLLAKGEHHKVYWIYGRDVRENNLAGALKWCNYYNQQGWDIYFNCTSRQESVKQRSKYAKGTYSELRASTLVWADLDCVKDNISITTAYNKLMQFKLKPSIVNFSGGGLQAFWCLSELWDISTEAQAREFSQWQYGFLNHQFLLHNLPYDKTTNDATREMRLPGFVNRKKSRNGAVAQIIY